MQNYKHYNKNENLIWIYVKDYVKSINFFSKLLDCFIT